jgi:hypothetical protein
VDHIYSTDEPLDPGKLEPPDSLHDPQRHREVSDLSISVVAGAPTDTERSEIDVGSVGKVPEEFTAVAGYTSLTSEQRGGVIGHDEGGHVVTDRDGSSGSLREDGRRCRLSNGRSG